MDRIEYLAEAQRRDLEGLGFVWISCDGTSMAPALRRGDHVKIAPVSPSELRVGDLVTFATPGGLVTHRLVGIAPAARTPWLMTRGDNERARDAPMSASALVGRAVARERLGRTVRLDGIRWRVTYPIMRAFARAKALSRALRPGRPPSPDERVAAVLGRAARVRPHVSSVDWDRLAPADVDVLRRLVRRHRLGPWMLAHPGQSAEPEWAAEVIESEATAWRSVCVEQLAGFDAAMDAVSGAVGVQGAAPGAQAPAVIVLKGAAYAERLYGSTCARPFGDVDFLVRSEDINDCVQALTAALWDYAPRRRFWWERTLEEHNFIPKASPSRLPRIELHKNLVDKPEFVPALAQQPEWLFEESVPAEVAGRRCLVLGGDATLLHAALHWHLHNYAGLGWGLDVAMAASGYGGEIDWVRVMELARRWKMAHIAWVAFSLARLEHGAPVPLEVTAELRPRDPLARAMVRMLASRPGALRVERRRRFDQALIFTLRDSLWRRIGAALLLPLRVIFWIPEERQEPAVAAERESDSVPADLGGWEPPGPSASG